MKRKMAPVAVALATSIGAGALVSGGSADGNSRNESSSDPTTTIATSSRPPHLSTVVRRDLRKTFDTEGVLSFGDRTGVITNSTGVVSGLPEEGDIPEFGSPLFYVDSEPVFVFKGSLPQYRDFTPGMSSGKDILQLEYALRISKLVDNGELEPNETIGKATWDALDRLYEHFNIDEPDELPIGSVLFVPDSFRVGSVQVVHGQRLTGAETIFERTDIAPSVIVDVDPSRLALFSIGTTAEVTLPTDEVLSATVSSHDSEVQGSFGTDTGAAADVAIRVELEFAHDADFDLPESAPVEIAVTREMHPNVIAVPLVALVALAGGGFAVERWDGQQSSIVPVQIGTAADGLVEIASGDLAVGDLVTVP